MTQVVPYVSSWLLMPPVDSLVPSVWSSSSSVCVKPLWLMSSSRSITSIVLRVSKSPVGSSSSSSCGSFASALAMAVRCISPPDSSLGRCSSRSCRPTFLSKSVALCSRCFLLSFPSRIIGSSTFSKADRVASRLNVWKTKPMVDSRSRDSSTSVECRLIKRLQISTSPVVGWSMVPSMLSKVVLPPPEGPRIITNSPRRMGGNGQSGAVLKLMFLSAVTLSSRPTMAYDLEMCRATIIGSPKPLSMCESFIRVAGAPAADDDAPNPSPFIIFPSPLSSSFTPSSNSLSLP
mmetsp:Transcript_43/g.138  ORF Transcript_43/g.138 Transcript_43/m.138 type:complete len:291 (+) Transcript_43:659-1531(+)